MRNKTLKVFQTESEEEAYFIRNKCIGVISLNDFNMREEYIGDILRKVGVNIERLDELNETQKITMRMFINGNI